MLLVKLIPSLCIKNTHHFICIIALTAWIWILSSLARSPGEVRLSFVNQKTSGSQIFLACGSCGNCLAQTFPFRIERLRTPEFKRLPWLTQKGVCSFAYIPKALFYLTYTCWTPTTSKTWSRSSAGGWSRPEPWLLWNAKPHGWFIKPSSLLPNYSDLQGPIKSHFPSGTHPDSQPRAHSWVWGPPTAIIWITHLEPGHGFRLIWPIRVSTSQPEAPSKLCLDGTVCFYFQIYEIMVGLKKALNKHLGILS